MYQFCWSYLQLYTGIKGKGEPLFLCLAVKVCNKRRHWFLQQSQILTTNYTAGLSSDAICPDILFKR